MGCLADASKACMAMILIVINCVLLAGGVLVLYASIHAKHSGWVDVVDTYWSGTNSLLTALEVVGGVIIGLAVLGSIAACCRWRMGLLLYAFVVVLVLLLFVVIAVFAFSLRSTSEDWSGKAYPADSKETSVKTEFDHIYCYAQGAYICNEMNVTEAATIFFPAYANSSLLASFSDLKGVNAMCGAFLTLVPSLNSTCQSCSAAKEFENFTSVLDWANDECPRTDSTLLWCGSYLGSGDDSAVTVGTAPYTQCRSAFLDLVSSSALTLGVGSVVVCAGALLIIIFSCVLRRRQRSENEYENVAYAGGQNFGTPQTGNAYSTPQTSQPFYGAQRSNDQLYASKV